MMKDALSKILKDCQNEKARAHANLAEEHLAQLKKAEAAKEEEKKQIQLILEKLPAKVYEATKKGHELVVYDSPLSCLKNEPPYRPVGFYNVDVRYDVEVLGFTKNLLDAAKEHGFPVRTKYSRYTNRDDPYNHFTEGDLKIILDLKKL